jgi:opacity protein-like surface antigen
MKKAKNMTIVLIILAVGLICSSTYGQDETAGDDKWQISFTPYFWAPSIDADVTTGGATLHADLSLDEILDNFDLFGFSGRVEMWKGDWGFFFDGQYVNADAEFDVTGPFGKVRLGADVEIVDSTLDFGVAYKLFKVPLEADRSRMLTFEPLGGLRYHYFKEEVKLTATVAGLGTRGTTLGGDEEWVEPFVGARLKYDLTKNLAAGVRTDFGGFGIGSASKLTWNLIAGVDWQFKKNMSLKLGYKIYDMDYERGSGPSRIGFDGKMQGPMAALTIHF